ncbi:hypothetical protein OAP42_02060 [Candidatus Marinimicrobia bacterium]|nr:hypothetical protein [Candidatus Neomarinimicrobiota bacterium]MDC0630863.1 hypothetical protein [Candidatus Neomarinimicrobiota bacterium]
MNELSIKLSLLISLLLPSCVSPPDYEDGLLENIPAVINDVDYFSLSILADDYSDNLKWDLDISLLEDDIYLSTLVIKDLSITSSDSSFIYIIDSNLDTSLTIGIFDEVLSTINDTISSLGVPKTVVFFGDKLTGRVEYQILKK